VLGEQHVVDRAEDPALRQGGFGSGCRPRIRLCVRHAPQRLYFALPSQYLYRASPASETRKECHERPPGAVLALASKLCYAKHMMIVPATAFPFSIQSHAVTPQAAPFLGWRVVVI